MKFYHFAHRPTTYNHPHRKVVVKCVKTFIVLEFLDNFLRYHPKRLLYLSLMWQHDRLPSGKGLGSTSLGSSAPPLVSVLVLICFLIILSAWRFPIPLCKFLTKKKKKVMVNVTSFSRYVTTCIIFAAH